ncbi:MAG TPA: ABC transporter permease, partial [Steroidobacteraceae bacterium]|nr:ABC transporter permease [Steroidobacteraceae bacterium]
MTLIPFVVTAAVIALLVALPWWSAAVVAALLAAWLVLTRAGRQAWSVTRVGISTVPQRLGAASVVVIGIAGVVGVLVALLAMAQGFQATLQETGSRDTAIVLRAGSQTEINSALDHDATVVIGDEPQVLHDAQGRPIASPELVVVASIPKKASGLDANVEVRGIGQEAWALRSRVRIVAGRRFTPGMRELIVGKRAAREFEHTALGSKIDLGGQPWTVVGTFDSGDEHDSEIWGDADVVASAYRRGDSRNSVTVRLKSPRLLDAFKASLASDPRFKVDATTTLDYYNRQSELLTRTIRILGTTVAVIMAIGAVF